MPTIEHLFCICQAGAEPALKAEVAARAPGLRLGFSRPGFVTFRLDKPQPLSDLELPRFVFARTRGASLGKAGGSEKLSELAARVWSNERVIELLADSAPVRLHVWQRDSGLPGEGGFEPGATALSAAARAAIVAAVPDGALPSDEQKSAGERGAMVLDVAIVEPCEWWIGCHRVAARVDRWPGGVPPIALPDHAASRAYLKMREALAWARTPAVRGDEWIELGCAPGGASQALLDAGMKVLGVDPAEVDPALAEQPDFRHLRMRAADAKRRDYAAARWLAADINAAPAYTLDAVESVVTHAGASIRGLVLTLKLPDWSLASPEQLRTYFDRIRSWGYRDVRARQLAFNRRELCVAALRSRGQRRLRRSRARRGRGATGRGATERPHGGTPPHHPPE